MYYKAPGAFTIINGRNDSKTLYMSIDADEIKTALV